MFKVGQKVKLKDSVQFGEVYNNIYLSEDYMFEGGLPITEVDNDDTVLLSNRIWYGFDAVEPYQEKFEQQEFSALSLLKNG